MITVKKDAIKYKTPEGMQSAGVLCNVGTFGVDWLHYMVSLNRAFYEVDFGTPTDLDIFLGKNTEAPIPTSSPLEYFCYKTQNVRNVKLKCKNPTEQSIPFSTVFHSSSVEVIDLTEFVLSYTTFGQTFRDCPNLVSILGKMDISNVVNTANAFLNFTNLVDVDFAENTIKVNLNIASPLYLSDASISNIINGFADMTGQTAIVLTVHRFVKERIRANQVWLATLTSKNVTLS